MIPPFHYRFACFKEDPLSYFRIFDYARWPRDRLELARFGTEDLLKLLDIFPGIFNDEEEKKRIKSQFSLLKAFLVNQNPNDMKEVMFIVFKSKYVKLFNLVWKHFFLLLYNIICDIENCTAMIRWKLQKQLIIVLR